MQIPGGACFEKETISKCSSLRSGIFHPNYPSFDLVLRLCIAKLSVKSIIQASVSPSRVIS